MLNFKSKYENAMINGVVCKSSREDQLDFYKELGWKENYCTSFMLGERTKRIYEIVKNLKYQDYDIEIFNVSDKYGCSGLDYFFIKLNNNHVKVTIADRSQELMYNVYRLKYIKIAEMDSSEELIEWLDKRLSNGSN